ncbi:type VI secretion system Vgr family protein, partial [Cronobacter muytjensii]|uniref:type VI secretion system Vgr family protein n=1 Tax=Cronobacter muytjensii TaxID=413501 RepID=UPI00137572A6
AKVVGPQGESIWTDKYGRVKVKFHWDRLSKGDDTSSGWVRVSSAWAGQGFGGVQIPRVGDEVVVDFINGDPDRPLITGRVYNEASMPPWALPAAATQMGFLSRSKDGSPDNANALRFEDKAGAEQVWLQAERNLDTHVKNDESHTVNGARSHYVRKNELHRVEANHTHAVKGGTEILTGKGKLDAAVEQYVLASGTQLRLVCGESAIELNANGKINLVGKDFNFFVEGDGYITTGGKLHLNTAGTPPGTTAPGDKHKENIDAAVQSKFSPGKESKGAPAPAPAITKSKPISKFKSAPPLKGDYVYKNDLSRSDIMPFNAEVINEINKSPTLQAQLKELRDKGWAIQPGAAGGGSYAEGDSKLIVMDPEHMQTPADTVQTLAHEAGHAMYPVAEDNSSRESYINSMLTDEGGATLNNIKVQREILANGGVDIDIAGSEENLEAYNSAYDKMERGELSRTSAAQAIGKVYGKGETPSGTTMNYHDYYGEYYDNR